MTVHDSPIGPLHLAARPAGLTWCGFVPAGPDEQHDDQPDDRRVLDDARRELDAYFAGTLRAFTVAVDLAGVAAGHRRVLAALREVGYGETTSYAALAEAAGLPATRDGGAARRVGAMMATNPVAVVVPCHRVVGADGSLTGYAGGLPAKRTLLDLEARDRTPMLW